MNAANRRQGAVLPVADRHPARRPHPHRPVQLGPRAPPRRHLRVPHRGHRRQPRLRGVLRRAARRAALARARLGRGPRGGRPARPVPAERAPGHLRRRAAAADRRGRGLRVVLHRGGDRGPPPRRRPRPEARLRQRRPRPHRRPARRVPRRGQGAGVPAADARPRHLLHRPGPRRGHVPGGHGARLRARPRRRHPALPAHQPASTTRSWASRTCCAARTCSPPPRARSRCCEALQRVGIGTGPFRYGHLPLVTGEGNRKLSKRDPQSNLFLYRERGFVPEGPAQLPGAARLVHRRGPRRVHHGRDGGRVRHIAGVRAIRRGST